jgi:hypothetical protein
MSDETEDPREHERKAREHDPHERSEQGAEGGSDAARKPPAAPADDDSSPVGDTDQHSSADA